MSIFSRFVNNSEKPFHTSGYAKAAHGDRIGAVSAQSFSQRLSVHQTRQSVRAYKESMVARGSNIPKMASPVTPDRAQLRVDSRMPSQAPQRQQGSGFREPSARTYNPFS